MLNLQKMITGFSDNRMMEEIKALPWQHWDKVFVEDI